MTEGMPSQNKNERSAVHARVKEMIAAQEGGKRAWKAVIFAAMLGVAHVASPNAQANEFTFFNQETVIPDAPPSQNEPPPPTRKPQVENPARPTSEKKQDKLVLPNQITPQQEILQKEAPHSIEEVIVDNEREMFIKNFMEVLEKERGLSSLVLSWDLEVQLTVADAFLNVMKKHDVDVTSAGEMSSALSNFSFIEEVFSPKNFPGLSEQDVAKYQNKFIQEMVKRMA